MGISRYSGQGRQVEYIQSRTLVQGQLRNNHLTAKSGVEIL